MTVFIDINVTQGVLTTLWNDGLDLPSYGTVSIKRASNVEYSDEAQAWFVFWPPRHGGEIVDGQPVAGFRDRKSALSWEVEWANGLLKENGCAL